MSNQSPKTPPTLTEQIKVMFDDAQFSPSMASGIYLDLFGNLEDEAALTFLGAINARFSEDTAPACLYFLMMEAFKRTDAHDKALNNYVQRLLKTKRRKGGEA
jgi:hypothetical protein